MPMILTALIHEYHEHLEKRSSSTSRRTQHLMTRFFSLKETLQRKLTEQHKSKTNTEKETDFNYVLQFNEKGHPAASHDLHGT